MTMGPAEQAASGTSLGAVQTRIERWLRTDALPLWLDQGVDRVRHRFYEALDVAGRPCSQLPVRSRVQGRQLLVFAEASGRGWAEPGPLLEEVAHLGYPAFWHPDGGYMFALAAGGTPGDPRRYAYEAAFALLGLAALYRLGVSPARTLAQAQRVQDWLDARLVHPAGGYHQGLDDHGALLPGPRSQNPHMHLLEAYLHWYRATGDSHWLERATGIVALFELHFFDPQLGAVREWFGPDWSRRGPDSRHLDPGHQAEWVWLLGEYGREAGRDLSDCQDALYVFADRHGRQPSTRLLCEEVQVDVGGGISPSRPGARLWSQTELLKAQVTFYVRCPLPSAAQALTQTVNAIFERHLDGPHLPGLWQDALDPAGRPTATVVPASTLYHLWVAFTAVLALGPPSS